MQTITTPAATVELSALELSDVDALISELEVQFQATRELLAPMMGPHGPQWFTGPHCTGTPECVTQA